MQDEDYTIRYYAEGWPKDANEKIGFLYPNTLISLTKDCYLSNEKIYESFSIH